MHPRHQTFLIIGSIEDADAAARRQRHHSAPHEIMGKLVAGRLLERSDIAALRVDARKNVLDRAVLAGCVHALQDDQYRPAVLRVKLLLKIAQAFPAGLEKFFGLVLVETAFLVGLVRPEMELA